MKFLLQLLLLSTLLAHAEISFNRDIRPILSDNCYSCHGFDPETRKAGLRLDTEEGLKKDLGGYFTVVPGDPDDSELYLRLIDKHPRIVMPPPETHKKLTAQQIQKIRRWIEQGAPYETHWAFTPIQRPSVPAQPTQPSPIDSFIQTRLQQEGLQPAPRADRYTLIRRVSLDLCGLPPTSQDIEQFINDPSPDAYHRMIERYLNSPRFGEHRARYWLDAARYSDTNGLHLDNYRSIWPYRDWVINAFNQNMPFDQFTIEQIAGDLLPNPTRDQRIATGFNRCNPTTNEGGSIAEEYLAIYAKDRVETTSTVWLGLTMGCAACHDHKYDPLSQKDFYQMSAFFRNTTQKAMDSNIYDTPPSIRLYTPEQEQQKSELQHQANKLKNDLNTLNTLSLDMQQATLEDTSWIASESRIEPTDHAGDFSINHPFTISMWIFAPTNKPSKSITFLNKSNEEGTGWIVQLLKNGHLELKITNNSSPQKTLNPRSPSPLVPGEWNHLSITYSGFYQYGRIENYGPAFSFRLNGQKAKVQGIGVKQKFDGDFQNDASLIPLEQTSEHAFRIAQVELFTDALHELENQLLATSKESAALTITPTEPNNKALLKDRKKLATKLYNLRKANQQLFHLKHTVPVTLVMEEKKESEPSAHMLIRGDYTQKGEEVSASVPNFLFPSNGDKKDRLALANWIVDPKNPLTARVTVNRMWQELFGTGIVKTSEDFGSQGTPPVHPQLLDWLAAEFIESGWNMKHMYRIILQSATYQQASNMSEIHLEKDPENRLLARGPRHRLDAETIRDQALYVSQLLHPTMGGEPVKPYQPLGVWNAVAYVGSNTSHFEVDEGEALYRRSLYTFWKRTAPPPSMAILDAPSRESCRTRRERTNTPMQALLLMNDPQFLEAARKLAERVLLETPSDTAARMLEMALGKPAEPELISIINASHDKLYPYYKNNPKSRRALLAIGESHASNQLDSTQLATWTMLASQIMNMDFFISKN